MSEFDAWAAGLFEGEGSFGSRRSSFIVKVCQADREVLDRLLAAYGGSICVDGKRRDPGHAPIFQWFLFGAAAERFAATIEPHLSARRLARRSSYRRRAHGFVVGQLSL